MLTSPKKGCEGLLTRGDASQLLLFGIYTKSDFLPIKLEFRETEFKEDITFFDDDNHVYFYNNKTWVSGRLPAFSMALGLRFAEFLSSLYLSRRVDDAQSRLHGMFLSSIRFHSSFFLLTKAR